MIEGEEFGRIDPNVRNASHYSSFTKQGTEVEVIDHLISLAVTIDAQNVLELGVHTGDTLVHLSPHVPGTYVAVDMDKPMLQYAMNLLDEMHDGQIKNVVALAGNYNHQRVKEHIMEHGPYDLIYIDADWNNRDKELHMCIPWLTKRGIIAVHDTGDDSPGVHDRHIWMNEDDMNVLHLNTPRGLTLVQMKADFQ